MSDPTPKPCGTCFSYFFNQWRSHGPDFPERDWDFFEKNPTQVGTHAPVDVFEGKARCRGCGKIAGVYCTYGEGYGFNELN